MKNPILKLFYRTKLKKSTGSFYKIYSQRFYRQGNQTIFSIYNIKTNQIVKKTAKELFYDDAFFQHFNLRDIKIIVLTLLREAVAEGTVTNTNKAPEGEGVLYLADSEDEE